MTAQEIGERLASLIEGASTSVSGGQTFARAVVDVPAERWADALRAVRDDPELSGDFFDWLSAVDEGAEGLALVAHLWSTRRRHGLLVRTTTPVGSPVVDSVVTIYPGAAWHERETHEMFGFDFRGHPGGLRPLLLPPEFEGQPMRKDFVLASRVVKTWPGAKEPGESEGGAPSRRAPARPPGVPDPALWGPAARPAGES
ncbi:NADH-quinone oxidoreductase subunit C [Pilimelia columellifera]|uniref:NADH:ubiquinone oxidoreductase 30kDa subunit domain-containing protein n=1 Tax=Pilimelia columellifera subsp. columellifera TaxID=706583 RepID=A0ABN3NEE1_9ACTN